MITQGDKLEIPPHGYVRYVDHMGSDLRIVEAARISYASKSKGDEADEKLLNYLLKNRHTSPFEQCSITFNIKMPIFVMRQFVRHRTFRLNEISARYTQMKEEFYMPSYWRKQSKTNKQASDTEPVQFSPADDMLFTGKCEFAYRICYQAYRDMISYGVANELARIVLPVALYTEIYVNCDLHNLMHFLRLRMDAHAQGEIQEVARCMDRIFAQLFPWTHKAFFTHPLKVATLQS